MQKHAILGVNSTNRERNKTRSLLKTVSFSLKLINGVLTGAQLGVPWGLDLCPVSKRTKVPFLQSPLYVKKVSLLD